MKSNVATSATIWSGADVALRQVIQFAVSIILARLVAPADFGVFALLLFLISVASVIVDLGLSTALIQRQDITHEDESTVYWVSLVAAVAIAAGLSLFSRSFAMALNIPILESLTYILAMNLVINTLGSVHSTLLVKRLQFKALAKIGATASLCSATVAVLLAVKGLGVWSLVAQSVVSTVLTTALLLLSRVWRPVFAVSFRSFKKMFGFGKYLLFSGMLEVFSSRLYSLMVAKMFGVTDLAYYNRAEATKQLPAELVSSIVLRVTFPIFSSRASDKARLRNGLEQTTRGLMLINVPIMLLLMVLAEPLVLTLFGAQWSESIPILQILCVAGLIWPLILMNLSILVAQGFSNTHFRLILFNKSIGIILMLIGLAFGLIGLALSQVAIALLGFLTSAYHSKIKLGYGPLSQVIDCAPIGIISAASAFLVMITGQQLSLSYPIELLLLSAMGAALVFVTCHLANLQSYNDLRKTLCAYLSTRYP